MAVRLEIVSTTLPDGRASEDWLVVLRSRLDPARYDSVQHVVHPLTPDEQAWDSVVRSRLPIWESEAPALIRLYTPVAPPALVRVVLGNRGTEDAFTADPRTIGFDLSALVAVYGSARDTANQVRIDRFFRHEFTHILQKAWLTVHPWKVRSPLDYALFDVWAEGLGNYYSLSGRWVNPDRHLTSLGIETLEELEPRFVERFGGLACADSTGARALLAGLSSGPFARKWGAVPAALWLATEPGRADSALRRLIVAGPAGVWDLADRHLTDSLRPALASARSSAARCSLPD